MREAEILRKKAELKRLEESRQRADNRIRGISHDIRVLGQSRRRKRLFQAGKILDRAGVLETFRPDELYAVLVENRERICDMEDEDVPYATGESWDERKTRTGVQSA